MRAPGILGAEGGVKEYAAQRGTQAWHPVREKWEERKDLEKGGAGEGFVVMKWEEAIKRDEELRWERRKLALERRHLMETVAEEEGGWKKDGEASVENWCCMRQGWDEEGEKSELATGIPRSRRESPPGPLGTAVGGLVALF